MADFIQTMTAKRGQEESAKRTQAARAANLPGATGEMTDTPDTLRSRLSGLIAEGLMKLGMSGRGAYDLGGRTTTVAEAGTPLGMVTGMEDLARAENPRDAAMAAIGLVPGVGKEARIAREWELFHPVGGGVKLRQPFSELTSTKVPTEGSVMLPDKPMSPEDVKLGSWLLPLYGDKTIAGQTLLDVQGKPLTTPQKLGGGGRFMQENPGRLWASDQGKATKISSKVQQLEQESGLPVLGTHVSMGAAGSDFAKMMARTLLQTTDQSKISPALAKMFDERMAQAGAANWPGIKNVNIEEWLATAPGGNRAELAKVMQLSPFQNDPASAFANVAAVRKAITEKELMDQPMLTSGMTVGQFARGGQTVPEAGTHESYSTDWLGQHLGNMGQVPYGVMFPDVLKEYLAKVGDNPKATGLPNVGRMVELKVPPQKITPQWQDQAMEWWLRRNDQ